MNHRDQIRQHGDRWIAWCNCGCRLLVGGWSREQVEQRITERRAAA
ncbi:hypothetical protein [Luteipulveratus mongoliensis]|nr:hypothetical protein [Luteipulveratus mongoliensis]